VGRRGRPSAPSGLSALLAQAPDRRTRRPAAQRSDDGRWYAIRDADGGDAGVAEIFLYDEIDSWWGVSAQDMIDELKRVTAPRIRLRINSPGGDVFDGLAIYQAFLSHPATVDVQIDGWAASAASYVAQAGDTVAIGANAMIMIHDAWGGCIGNAADMHATGDLLDKISANIADIYAARADGDPADWRKAMLAETWYTGAEAVTAGLADEVLTAGKRRKPCADGTCDEGCPTCEGSKPCPCTDECGDDCPCCGSDDGDGEGEGGGMGDRMRRSWDLAAYGYRGPTGIPDGRPPRPAAAVPDTAAATVTISCSDPSRLAAVVRDVVHRPAAAAPDATAPRPAEPRPVDTACPVHHTDVVEGTWDAGAQEKRLESPMPLATAKAVYSWYDADQVDGDTIVKAACKLPHHQVGADGTPGAAVASGVRNAMSRLPQTDMPDDERAAVEKHLQAHLDDLGDGQDHAEPATDAAEASPDGTAGDGGAPTDPQGAPHEPDPLTAPPDTDPVADEGDTSWPELSAAVAAPTDTFASLTKGLWA
jgi:ATP-dependent protease ClpP protease subunit